MLHYLGDDPSWLPSEGPMQGPVYMSVAVQRVGLTPAEANVVMNATAQAIRQDMPGINAADAKEFMYQMAGIAQAKWTSPIPSGGDLISKIRGSAEYQKILSGIKTRGTIYGDAQERALSPYFQSGSGGDCASGDILEKVKCTLAKVPTWAWLAGGGALALIILLPSGGGRRR